MIKTWYLMDNSNTREQTFQSSQGKFDESTIAPPKQLDPWWQVVVRSIVLGILFGISFTLLAIGLNFLGFGGFFDALPMFFVIAAIVFWVISSMELGFGSSPTIAQLRHRFFKSSPYPKHSQLTLRQGISKLIIGCVLILFS